MGSRQDFTLPAKWEIEVQSSASNNSLKFVSLGKTRYHTGSRVKEVLWKRNMDMCSSQSSESTDDEELSDYLPSPEKHETSSTTKRKVAEAAEVPVEGRFFYHRDKSTYLIC